MNKIKDVLKNKKNVITIVSIALVVCGIGGYLFYDNSRKQVIINKMSITFTDVKEIEYGTKDFNVQKELVKEVKDAEIKTLPTIDTSKIGEIELTFVLEKSKLTKEVTHKVKVVDTKAPEIILEAESKELTVGDEYDFMANITSVKDVVDGDIILNKEAPETNKKATEEYNKLANEDIKEDTKIGDKALSEFLVETTKGEDDKETSTLYLKNGYYVDGSVDIATAGEYTINVIAVDKNGMKSTQEFKVTVKEKEAEQPVSSVSNNVGGYTSSGGGNYTPAPTRGSKSDIVNTALAQVGKPYVYRATGPDSFDCGGLIYYAYTQNGWSIPRFPEGGGTRISYDQVQAGDIVWMPNINHLMLITGKTANGLSAVGANNTVSVGTTSAPAQAIQENSSNYIFIRY